MIRGESRALTVEVLEAFNTSNYYAHTVLDNGGEPFAFMILSHSNTSGREVALIETQGGNVFHRFMAKEIWLGSGADEDTQDLSMDHFKCNTVLFVQDRICIWLGRDCQQFQLDPNEQIVRFVSWVGNSCVPYGWIETSTSYIGLDGLSCDSYRIKKTPAVEKLIHNEELCLYCLDLSDPKISALTKSIKFKRIHDSVY